MKFKSAIIILSTSLVFIACSNDTHQFSSTLEEVLPGKWQIASIYLPADNEGITYQGQTFFEDTTLFDVGEVAFNPFFFYTSAWYVPVSSTVHGTIKLEDEIFPFEINNLILSSDGIHGFLNPVINNGIDTIDTPGEEFIWSSKILSNNYWIWTDGEQHIRLESFRNHVIDLEKIE